MPFGNLFDSYLKLLAFFGGPVEAALKVVRRPAQEGTTNVDYGYESSVDHDALATKYGRRYRGIGILIGVLSIAVLFLALMPISFHMSEGKTSIVHWAEILVMVLLFGLLVHGRLSGFHARWLHHRMLAELKRYQPLKLSVDLKKFDAGTFQLVEEFLCGKNGQIPYNLAKQKQYSGVEAAASALSWFAFLAAATAAVLGSKIHSPVLIMFTSFCPAAVGAVHGINAFLGISELEEAHGEMAKSLKQYREVYVKLWSSGDHSDKVQDDLVDTIRKIYDALVSNDGKWQKTAHRSRIAPV